MHEKEIEKRRKRRSSVSLHRSSTKSSALKTEPPTMKKEIGASGRTGLSLAAQPSRVSHRRRKSWAKPRFTLLQNGFSPCQTHKGCSRMLSAAMQEVIEYRTLSFSCDADQAQRGTIRCCVCCLSLWRKAVQRVLRRGQRLHPQGRRDLLSQTYKAEQKQLEAEAITLQQEIEVQERQNENIEKFIQKAHKYVGIKELDGYALRELVSAVYVDAPDKSSGKRVHHIHIKYDGLGFIPLNELMKKETA